jgi:hypothetical protein
LNSEIDFQEDAPVIITENGEDSDSSINQRIDQNIELFKSEMSFSELTKGD